MINCPPNSRTALKSIEIDVENPNFPLFVSMRIRSGVGLSKGTIEAILRTKTFTGINPIQGLENESGELVTIEDLQDGMYTEHTSPAIELAAKNDVPNDSIAGGESDTIDDFSDK